MEEDKLPDSKIGSVKAAISSYRERMLEENYAIKKFQTTDPLKPNNRTRELHRAERDTDQLKESRRLAERATFEAESALSAANKTVKDLTRRIEELNSRGKSQMLEKLKMDKTKKVEHEQVKRELQSIKRVLSRLRVDMASILGEKSRAEEEIEMTLSKAECFLNSIKALDEEIEKIDEEHVLVELARLEAIKEYQVIEAERRENAKKYTVAIDEKQRKQQEMIRETEDTKDMESKLAVTLSDINILQSEMEQLKEMDEAFERNEISKSEDDSSGNTFFLESVLKELKTKKHDLASAKEESFQFMASMDVIRNELRHIMDQTARLKKREEKTETNIQNLNSKLLRAKSKLEIASAAEEKAKSVTSNLTVTLEQLKSDIETAKNRQSMIVDENSVIKADIQRTKIETVSAEKKLQSTLQELNGVKSPEASAMENLKFLSEKTMRSRALACGSGPTITISKFEYDYLKGHAAEAGEVAGRKVEAAQAWVEALKASEKEIHIKCEILQRESREMNKGEDLWKKSRESEELDDSQEMVDKGDFEKWRQMMEPEYWKPGFGISLKATNRRRGRARGLGSTLIRGTPRSTSFSVRRRTKVVTNLAKFFNRKGIEGDI